MRAYRLAAVVLNYRTPDLVLDCLRHVVPQLDPARDVALVVDNASGDESPDRIRKALAREGWEPLVRLVESPENGGFAAGNNLGIRSVEAEAYLLLNSDTLPREGSLERLLAALRERPDAAIVSPRLEGADGTAQVSCFRFHSPASELIDGARHGWVRRLLARWEVPLPVADARLETDWTSFAAVLVRGRALETVGLLDERFFMYYEDADYCRRVRRGGWTVLHEPAARVVHLRGGSSPVKALTRARRRRPAYYYASRRRYFLNAYGRAGLLAANLLRTLGWTLAWLRDLVQPSELPRTVEREIRDTWRLG